MNQTINHTHKPSANDIPPYLRRSYNPRVTKKEVIDTFFTFLILLIISAACWYFAFFPVKSAHAATEVQIVKKVESLNTFCADVIQERIAAHDTAPLTGDLLTYCGN